MGGYIGGLYELYECITLFVAGSKHDDLGFAERHHLDFLDQLLGKGGDRGFGTKCDGITVTGIHH